MPFTIGFLVYPHMTMLDVAGPAQVFSFARDIRLEFVWRTRAKVPTDAGFSIQPTSTFEDCPALDMIFVPGGGGQVALMTSDDVLGWLRRQAGEAHYVTSVCSGSLLLGAAGLLRGYRAGCHWAVRDHLRAFGATPVAERVVWDRNRVTGGGVTAGLDFALSMVAEIRGPDEARAIQLALEYDPQPPFDSGSIERADEETIVSAQRILSDLQREQATARQ